MTARTLIRLDNSAVPRFPREFTPKFKFFFCALPRPVPPPCLALSRASSIAMPDDGAKRGCRPRSAEAKPLRLREGEQRVPRWSAERRPGFLARGPRVTGPPPPSSDFGSRKLGVQA